MEQTIQVKVQVPDPIESVFVVSTTGHGSWGKLKADRYYECPEVFTSPTAARDYIHKIATFHFQHICSEVEKCKNPFDDKTKAVLDMTAWDTSIFIADGVHKLLSEMPFLVEYQIHNIPIDRWAKGEKSSIILK